MPSWSSRQDGRTTAQARLLPLRALQDSMGGAGAIPGPQPHRNWSVRHSLVGPCTLFLNPSLCLLCRSVCLYLLTCTQLTDTAGKVLQLAPPPYNDLALTSVNIFHSSAMDTKYKVRVALKKLARPFQSAVHALRTYRELRYLKHMKHENVSKLLVISNNICS